MMIKMKRYYAKLKCPKCESDNIARYQYGMPVMDPDMERDIEKGKVVLGGCCIMDDDPDRHCNDCDYDW